jgi:hypothetical protein
VPPEPACAPHCSSCMKESHSIFGRTTMN